ncbi:MAG: hypothetical protein DSO02_03285, partial [Hadesarchaea archaeon]
LEGMRVAAGRALGFLRRSKVGYVILAFLLVTVVGALVLYAVEHGENPNLLGFLDALFLALSIESTVGFGNIVVVTTGGKVLAMGLMISGICLYASLIGLLAGFIIRGSGGSRTEELEARLRELDERLEKMLEREKRGHR